MTTIMEVSAMPDMVPVPEHDSQWYQRRSRGIGGSEAAAVLGESKYPTQTPYQIWLRKTGRGEPVSDNPAMKAGRLLEPVIRNEYANRTGRVVYNPGFLVHNKYSYIIANVDGLCDDRVLEIKTSRFGYGYGEDDMQVPVEYYYQVQHYMLVTGKRLADVVVLVGGQDFRIYTIEANDTVHEAMLAIYPVFWQCVLDDVPPELSNFSDLKFAYPKSETKGTFLSGNAIASIGEIKEIQSQIKALDSRKAELEQRIEELQFTICNEMGDSDSGVDTNGKTLITWKYQDGRTTFDSKRLQEENPDLYAMYLKHGDGFRRVLIK